MMYRVYTWYVHLYVVQYLHYYHLWYCCLLFLLRENKITVRSYVLARSRLRVLTVLLIALYGLQSETNVTPLLNHEYY